MSNTHDTAPPVGYIMLLRNGVKIPNTEYDEFRREIENALQWLPPGVSCSIENLVTPRFWLPKTKQKRRDLGRVLASWVANGELPLQFVGNWRNTNKRYRLRT